MLLRISLQALTTISGNNLQSNFGVFDHYLFAVYLLPNLNSSTSAASTAISNRFKSLYSLLGACGHNVQLFQELLYLQLLPRTIATFHPYIGRRS
jgi:hypothetical protein